MNADKLILATLILPIFGVIGIVLARRWPNLREGVTLSTAVLLFIAVLRLLEPVSAGLRPGIELLSPIPG